MFLDTNILIEATDERRRHHQAARAVLESPRQLVFAAQVIREYLAVATRPAPVNGLGLPLAAAMENVREFRERVRLLPEERPVLATFMTLLAAVPCSGARVHDAHLIATAIVHRVNTIVSLNGDDLRPFAGSRIAVVTPAEVLADRGPRRRSE